MNGVQRTTTFIAAAFLATTLVLAALLVLQWSSFKGVESTAQLVHRTLETQRDFTALGNRIAEAETGQRGFLLTGIQAYLKPYRAAELAVPRHIARLKRLVADNPSQTHRIALIDTLSEAKLAELRATVKLANEGDRDSALEVVRTNVGDSLMTSIRLVLRGAMEMEDSLLNVRQITLDGAFHRRDTILAGLAVLLAVMLLIIAFILRRLQHYQDLVTICAWSKAVNYDGEWLSFEDYLQRKFGLVASHGISPEALAALEAEVAPGK